MLRCNRHVKQLPRRSGCYVVTSGSSIFQDALDATLQQPWSNNFQEASGCYLYVVTSVYKPLPRRSGCYVVFSSNIQDVMVAMLYHPLQFTSRTFWMLCCHIHFQQLSRRSQCYCCSMHLQGTFKTCSACYIATTLFKQLPRRFGCYLYVVTSVFKSSSKTLWMLHCNIHFQ